MMQMSVFPRKLEPKQNSNGINLRPGQNIFSITIRAAIFSPEGCDYLYKKKQITKEQTEFTTCAIIEFADFETEVSCIGFGKKPIYDYTSKFLVVVDDFFLNYVQTTSIPITIFHTNGMEFEPIGYTLANFQNILNQENQTFEYISDMLSSDMRVIGQLEYQLDIAISMPLAVRAYHERTAALNLTKKIPPELFKIPFKIEGATNLLNIKILNGYFTNVLESEEEPSIYGTIHFDSLWRALILPAKETYSPTFNFSSSVPLRMNSDLDRQLRTGKLLIVFADDRKDWNYGYVKIPLMELALNNTISGKFDVQNSKGKIYGFIEAYISWESPYITEGTNVSH